ncbi:MAG TPA: hydroxyacylglutathione hydrolase [Burkholderiaceae bacterium]|jgi:hydroxyacylglutathione hydrolase
MSKLSVLTVPAFNDNYLWLIHNGTQAVAVDPGDAGPIMAALEAHKLSLVAILLTHHHADHVGGVEKLLQHINTDDFKLPVYGPRSENIAGVTTRLAEGDQVHIAQLPLDCTVLDVPGHTSGHIAYVFADQNWLFCGDTLFAGGCGRLFEGTPAQMVSSLAKLSALPDSTLVFCAHEYTLGNLRFALAAEPDNLALKSRIVLEQEKRTNNIPTVPSTIGLEKETNPFLRYREPSIIKGLQASGRLHDSEPIAAFAALRNWKNEF